ncbi:MAG TPA: hypothetical protein HPP69_03390 [Deltaproteobacteria bacterium]|nr:hypothetical protein [Deltaproteobacteria bacterium]
MTMLLDQINRFDRRHLLLGVAALLLLLNLGRLGANFLDARQQELGDRLELLSRYRESVLKLPQVQQRVSRLQKRTQYLESFLFTGDSEEQIASAMQIKLQSEISQAGLSPEFIQPLRNRDNNGTPGVNDIGIKIRMSGSLNNFAAFIKAIYSGKQLFKIESLTIKPFKKDELKIFLEVRGVYRLTPSGGESS